MSPRTYAAILNLEPSTPLHSPARPYLRWLEDKGVKRLTVHGVRDLSGRVSVRDARFMLWAGGIPVDLHTDTVAVDDLLKRWPDA